MISHVAFALPGQP